MIWPFYSGSPWLYVNGYMCGLPVISSHASAMNCIRRARWPALLFENDDENDDEDDGFNPAIRTRNN
jgi:hypothetical protein